MIPVLMSPDLMTGLIVPPHHIDGAYFHLETFMSKDKNLLQNKEPPIWPDLLLLPGNNGPARMANVTFLTSKGQLKGARNRVAETTWMDTRLEKFLTDLSNCHGFKRRIHLRQSLSFTFFQHQPM